MEPKVNSLPQFTPALIAQFHQHLKQFGSCLLWQGALHRQGYGYFRVQGKRYRTNRIAYFLFYGIDPGELDVCHTCDCTGCCEPLHLFLGTQTDNNHDMMQKGRCRQFLPGMANNNAKLTDTAVREIRESQQSNVNLAQCFNVSAVIIGLVKRRKRWTHII
jgi:hypothetical protein